MTLKTASPARACRNIEKGFAGLTLGVMVPMRSALIAFLRFVGIGVRYLDLDACGTGCAAGSGVLVFEALIMALGPGIAARFDTDLLRLRDDFNEPTIDEF